jgi:hypothetical protein
MSRTQKATVRDWRRGYGVVDPTDKEVISFSFWARLTFTSNSTTSLQFFATPQTGQNGNLALAGQLANGTAFLVQAIRVCPLIRTTEMATQVGADGAADGALQDMFSLIWTGSSVLKVGDKEYGKWLNAELPAGAGLYGQMGNVGTNAAASASQFQWANNGVPDPRSVYVLPIPIVIPPQYTFRLLMDWSAVVVLSTATGATCPIVVMLDGELMRPKQ